MNDLIILANYNQWHRTNAQQETASVFTSHAAAVSSKFHTASVLVRHHGIYMDNDRLAHTYSQFHETYLRANTTFPKN